MRHRVGQALCRQPRGKSVEGGQTGSAHRVTVIGSNTQIDLRVNTETIRARVWDQSSRGTCNKHHQLSEWDHTGPELELVCKANSTDSGSRGKEEKVRFHLSPKMGESR